MKTTLPILAIAGLALAACAGTTAPPTMVGNTGLGPVLTDAKGMTLYTFDRDPPGKSACNGQCAQNWPPLVSDDSTFPTGAYSFVLRDDGRQQWAYKGKPLYTWVKDTRPGETTGENFNNVWHVARP